MQHQKEKAVARKERDEDALKDGLDHSFCEPKTLTGSWAVGLCVREREELGGPSTLGTLVEWELTPRFGGDGLSTCVGRARSVSRSSKAPDSTAQQH